MFVAILVAKYFVVWNGIIAENWCWNKELKEMNRGYVQKTNQTIDSFKTMCSYNYRDQNAFLPLLPSLTPEIPFFQMDSFSGASNKHLHIPTTT